MTGVHLPWRMGMFWMEYLQLQGSQSMSIALHLAVNTILVVGRHRAISRAAAISREMAVGPPVGLREVVALAAATVVVDEADFDCEFLAEPDHTDILFSALKVPCWTKSDYGTMLIEIFLSLSKL